MHVDYPLFLRALKETTTRVPMTPRRVPYLLTVALGYPLFETWNGACLSLDRLLYPAYRDVKVQKPIFIFGNPRSGTTFMHRLMSLDEERFSYFTTGELIFPALTQARFFEALAGIDRRLTGGRLERLLSAAEDEIFKDFDKLHRIRHNEAEEDEALFMHAFGSPLTAIMLPGAISLKAHVRFDELPAPVRRRYMAFYEDCLKRLLYRKGPTTHPMSKSTSFSTKIRSLAETFPDARFIYMLRNPLISIASTQSLCHATWKHQLDFDQLVRQREALFDESCNYYRKALAELGRLDDQRKHIVLYEHLVTDPESVVLDIYEWLGFTPTESLREKLHEASASARGYRSQHTYSLGQYGLSEALVREALPEVFDHFTFNEQVRDVPVSEARGE